MIYSTLRLNGNTTSSIHGDHTVDEPPLKRPARIRRCHPVGEIISEFQAVASWLGEGKNSLRRWGLVKRQSCKCRNRIIHSRASRSVNGREIAIEGVVDA